MKALLFTAIILTASASMAFAQGEEEFVTTGSNVDCLDANGNPANQMEQGRMAIREMLKSAEGICGKDSLPIQISPTEIESAHSCFHYSLGAIARAHFKCGTIEVE
jgi:hypothetical protein